MRTTCVLLNSVIWVCGYGCTQRDYESSIFGRLDGSAQAARERREREAEERRESEARRLKEESDRTEQVARDAWQAETPDARRAKMSELERERAVLAGRLERYDLTYVAKPQRSSFADSELSYDNLKGLAREVEDLKGRLRQSADSGTASGAIGGAAAVSPSVAVNRPDMTYPAEQVFVLTPENISNVIYRHFPDSQWELDGQNTPFNRIYKELSQGGKGAEVSLRFKSATADIIPATRSEYNATGPRHRYGSLTFTCLGDGNAKAYVVRD